MRNLITLFLITIILFSCQQQPPIEQIEEAHHKSAFLSQKTIQFNIDLVFGGKTRLKGVITTETNSSAALITLDNGNKILVDGKDVVTNYAIKQPKKVRFDAYTWTYFFLFPYKLSDEGSQWSEQSVLKMNSELYNSQKLTFKPNVGDAPDDWYIVYSNQNTNLIDYAAYIVTANKTTEQAEKDPHAIQYSNYKLVNNIPIAHKWTFWQWNLKQGVTKEIGNANITNVHFLENNTIIEEARVELKGDN